MASRSASSFSGRYNPQQWGAVNNVSPNSMSMAGEHRQTNQSSRTAHLAPRPVGPDEPVASPPPPYSPRRDQQSQDSPRGTSDIISPANTTSPDTECSRYGTPVSAATTLSPDLVSRFPGGRSPLRRQHTSPNESPNFASLPSFPPPPGQAQRMRAGSKNTADRLLSSLALRGKPSKVTGDAIDTLQDHTAQMLAQASSANYNKPMIHPPAARRAASTGGIGLAGGSSRSTSHSPSPVTWEPNLPLPPPPPGPPPASVRSQSLTSRSIESPSSALPLRSRRPPGTRTVLGTVPPTPADWKEEDGINDRAPSCDRSHGPSSLHIDTGSILRKRRSGADYPLTATTGGSHPRRDSSAGGLFRSPAVRTRSAMGIRERRSESRAGKGRAVGDSAVESSSSTAPWADDFEDVKPSNLVLSAQVNASKQGTTAKSTPRSGRTMQSLGGTQNSPELQKFSGKAVSFASSTPHPKSPGSQHFSATSTTPPFSPGRETLDQFKLPDASTSLPREMLSVQPPKPSSGAPRALSLIVPPGSEQRPVSHLLHRPVSHHESMQVPLRPSSKIENPLEDLLGPESPKLFAGRAIERHRKFAEREAAAPNDAERLDLFVQYMKAESRIRREQYASVFEEDGIDVDELTRGLFGRPSTDQHFHNRQQSLSRQDTSKRTSIASSALGDSSSQDDSSAVLSRKRDSPSSASSIQQQEPYWEGYVPCLSPIASMSIATGQEDDSRVGRAPSRWFEDQSQPGDMFKVLERTKCESKYMGVPREARNAPAAPSASVGGGQWQPPGASRYPPEKTGWHEEETQPPCISPMPSSAPFTPDPRKLDISRLVTLPPPYPRHHPAVNNSHPDLADVRAVVRSLHEKEETDIIGSYHTQSRVKWQRADTWCKHQRSLHRQNIEHGNISQMDIHDAALELEEKIASSEKQIAQIDFEDFQQIVLTPLHALFSDRIKLADATLDKLSGRLFSDSQSQSPNMPQEEGDDEPELLEKLTQLKWLFEARETLYRQIYDLVSERNSRYRTIVLLPYKQSGNVEKHTEAELFFAEDEQERRFRNSEHVCKRAQNFLSIVEDNVMRGVEIQLGAFWDIAPYVLEVLHRVPKRLEGFEVQLPDTENSSSLQYLYSLLGHAERSTYQLIESQINLLCLLHEIRSHSLAAECKVKAQGRDVSRADEEERRREETRLTEDLREKVGVVEGQWQEALGREIMDVKERVRGALLEEGGWDDEDEI